MAFDLPSLQSKRGSLLRMIRCTRPSVYASSTNSSRTRKARVVLASLPRKESGRV